MRLAFQDLARFVGLGLICLCLDACVPTGFKVSSGDPYVKVTEEIQLAKSTIAEVRTLLGEPHLSSAEWRIDIFSREAPGTIYTVWWLYPIWWEKDSLDEYLMVTYSDQGVVTSVRSYEGGQCDFKCGGKIKIGHQKVVDLFVWGKRVILLASREETSRRVSAKPGPDECVVFLIPRIGPVYLDARFVQYSEAGGFFRLVVTPGDHTISSFIESEWNADSTPGRPLNDSELNESEHRTQSTWDFSCTGGTTLTAAVECQRTKWWRASTTYCVISSMSDSDAADTLSERRMIIPFDPIP